MNNLFYAFSFLNSDSGGLILFVVLIFMCTTIVGLFYHNQHDDREFIDQYLGSHRYKKHSYHGLPLDRRQRRYSHKRK